jgi:hypothetical protein
MSGRNIVFRLGRRCVPLIGDPERWSVTRMITRLTFCLLLLAQSALAQNVYSLRVIGHTPFYERILLPKGNILRPLTLRGVDDLKPEERYAGTNRIDRVFSDPSRERTNGFNASCFSEVPISSLTLRCPGGLLDLEQVSALLRDTVAIPRNAWTNHVRSGTDWRYVFSLVGSKGQEYVIDERAGAFALVFFPDRTYRCVVGPGYSFLDELQQNGPANRSQPIHSETNQPSGAAGPAR